MIKAGDILVASWGYDQTNVEWYRVEKRSGNRVYLQPLEGLETPDEDPLSMCGHSMPGGPMDEPVFYRNARPEPAYSPWGIIKECVRIKPWKYAGEWDGLRRHCSWDA